jgi:4-carboxymuconolactone decarboxylase
MSAQENNQLDAKQQSIVSIAAFTANGNLEKLKPALNSGLDAGLTVNEIKEILVQLYAYCGFPRSINGILTFMEVSDDRKQKGIQDVTGKEATPIVDNGDKYERGRKTLETLSKAPQAKPAPGYGAFVVRIDTFLKEHLFADIFDNDILTYQQRELATISVLAALSGVEFQLQGHIGMGMNTGLTEGQLQDAFTIVENNIGKSQAEEARTVLAKVLSA